MKTWLVLGLAACAIARADATYQFTEQVAGDFVPLTAFNTVTQAEREAAGQSFDKACDAWKKEIAERFGTRLLLSDCGDRELHAVGYETWRQAYVGDIETLPNWVGVVAASDAKVIVSGVESWRLDSLDRTVSGTVYRFPNGDFAGAVAAARAAFDAQRTACGQWKAQLQASGLAKTLISLSCEIELRLAHMSSLVYSSDPEARFGFKAYARATYPAR